MENVKYARKETPSMCRHKGCYERKSCARYKLFLEYKREAEKEPGTKAPPEISKRNTGAFCPYFIRRF